MGRPPHLLPSGTCEARTISKVGPGTGVGSGVGVVVVVVTGTFCQFSNK